MKKHTVDPGPSLAELVANLRGQETEIRQGGGGAAIDRHHGKNRLTARERIARLVDAKAPLVELGLWAGYGMYADWGGAPAAGVVTVIGAIAGRRHMIVAN